MNRSSVNKTIDRLNHLARKNIIHHHLVLLSLGTVHVWWGVSSCTDNVHVTGGFLDKKKKHTLFNIKCRNGKIIRNHSAYPMESETILPPGTYLKVKIITRWYAHHC